MLTSEQIYRGQNLEILTLPVGQLQANCYLIIDKKSSNCLIVDPGDDAEYIENIISDKNVKPIKIVCTHGHFDHVGVVLELKLAYQIQFFLNQKDEFLLKKARNSASYFVGIDTGPAPKVDEYLEEKKPLLFGKNRFKILETPGHTPGSICLYEEKEAILFCGDVLFADGGVGRTDFAYSNSVDLKNSLTKIFRLPKTTTIFPGHARNSTLEVEIKYHVP